MALSCKYKERNERGILVERCLRDAWYMVNGKSYCSSHVIYAGIEKEQQEEQLSMDNKSLDIDDTAKEVDEAYKWLLMVNRHASNIREDPTVATPSGRPSLRCIDAASVSYQEALDKHWKAVEDLYAK